MKRIQVKETVRFWGDLEGPLENIINSLQLKLNEGWEGIEEVYERDYGDCCDSKALYLYKHRLENDEEYEKRVKEKEKQELEAKNRRKKEYERLKEEFGNET